MDSPQFDEHDTGPRHPECAARLRAIRERLRVLDLDVALEIESPRAVDRALLERVHASDYVARVEQLCARGPGQLDPDTPVSLGSFRAARLAAGAAVGATSRVVAGEWTRAFCSVRPPGHHAGRARGQGFCLFNNVVIAAEAALESGDVQRVAIVDFDAHHGNGTQGLCERRAEILYASWHQSPLYPGSGAAGDAGPGPGVVVNCPLPRRAGSAALIDAWHQRVRPALCAFEPELMLISAGFDADRRDPLADLAVDARGFHALTSEVARFSEDCCAGRIVSVLEGGYHLDALAEDVAAHVEALLGWLSPG